MECIKIFKLEGRINYMIKGVLAKAIFIVFFLIIFIQSVCSLNQSGSVVSEIEVPNSPPYLLKPIPNQSWAAGTYLINAFDLDDYFFDPEGYSLNYSYSDVDNITVEIDSSNNVSFYPDLNFTGIRSIVFYASDGEHNASSNIVYLNVGVDNEPPQWSSPQKSKSTIYQNSYVNFTTTWTDNFGLKSYVFSINQGSWVNYSGTFSGLVNVSEYRIQISAPAGSVVRWMFCAYDTSDNLNCTDVQNFSVSARPVPTPPSGGAGGQSYTGEEYGGALGFLTKKKTKKFSVNVNSFKVFLKQGATTTRVLEITNIGNTNLSFNLSINGLEDFVVLSDYNFTILPGEKKKIIVDFNIPEDVFPGQYFGEIVVNSSEVVKIPVVLTINCLDLEFEVNVSIPEKYKRVKPGSLIKANIKIKSLKDISDTNLTLYIALKDFYGNIYDSSRENFLFSSSLDLERNLSIPKNVRAGEYLFYARVSNDKTMVIDCDFFEVGTRLRFAAFLKSSFVFVLILFLSFFAIILVARYRREKEKERILNLYIMLNELKKLIAEGRFDEAAELYIRIKTLYKEPPPRSILENKEELKNEIKKLADQLSEKEASKKVESEAGESEKKEAETPLHDDKKTLVKKGKPSKKIENSASIKESDKNKKKIASKIKKEDVKKGQN